MKVRPVSWMLALALCGVLERYAAAEPVDDVRPMIGTGGDGHTFPGATYPFGMVQLSPDTGRTGWEHCSGYHLPDATVLGFSHTHLSGTGAADFGDILVMPTVGDAQAQLAPPTARRAPGYASAISHDEEWASPGYYKVVLKDFNVTAELTATARAGFHKYTFPATEQAHIMVDLVHGVGSQRILDSALTVESPTMLTGYRRSRGWAQNKVIYFAMEFSRPFTGVGLLSGSAESDAGAKEVKGPALRAHVDFKTAARETILVRVGISGTGVEGAKKNLAAEIATWDFAAVTAGTRKAWVDALSAVTIETPDAALRETFYTAMYHALLAPNLFNDVDGRYQGADHQVHEGNFQYYSTFSLWDTFRAEHPMLTLAAPGRVSDFVSSMLAHSEQFDQHTLPVWTLASNETWTMIGYHSVPVITDAYLKGFRDYDAEKVYAAMRRTATENRNQLGQYQQNGYIFSPTAAPAPRGGAAATSATAPGTRGSATASSSPAARQREGGNASVSRTLEYAYDDWCMAQMAKALGKTEDAALFAKRAQNFRNVFNAETKFMQGRLSDGAFRTSFDPTTFSADFTEANAWQYLWFVPQDVPGLIGLLGGDDLFLQKLEQTFDMKPGGRGAPPDAAHGIGQYIHGNEPVHHVAYIFNYAGRPDKTAERVRQVMTTLYSNKTDGLCGNDDCGQMSAWYALSAMGFYPVNPALGVYVIGSPLVDRATIRLDPKFYPRARGGTFVIRAENNSAANKYVQSATLNGAPLNRSYFTHAELSAGGELVLRMGDKPNPAWGRAPADRPPSAAP